jgi:hypothetical protein
MLIKFRIPEIFLGALLAIVVFAMGLIVGSSLYPSQTTQQQSAEKRSNGTGQSQPDESTWHWMTHDATGFFTLGLFVVAFFQLGLFYRQLVLIRKSLDEAKIAANASTEAANAATTQADLARSEFIATHRPKLVVRELYMPPSTIMQNAMVRYVIANVGSGSAEIVESHVMIQRIDRNDVLRPLESIKGENSIGSASIEAVTHIVRTQDSMVTHQSLIVQHMRVGRGQDVPELFFRGFIIYADKNGLKRRTAFCRQYDFGAHRFRIVDDPDHEYAD